MKKMKSHEIFNYCNKIVVGLEMDSDETRTHPPVHLWFQLRMTKTSKILTSKRMLNDCFGRRV